MATAYVQDHGDNLYRRSLYTLLEAHDSAAAMANFDASARESHMVRPVVTNTPLQALDLMNDVAYRGGGAVLAQRVMKEGGATPPNGSPMRFAWPRRASRKRRSARFCWMRSGGTWKCSRRSRTRPAST